MFFSSIYTSHCTKLTNLHVKLLNNLNYSPVVDLIQNGEKIQHISRIIFSTVFT